MSLRVVLALSIAGVVVVLPGQAGAAANADGTGGTSYSSSTHGGTAAQAQASQGGTPVPTATAPGTTAVPGTTAAPVTPATVNPDGTAVAPAGAPAVVTALIAAGNQIATLPYKYGGGHGSFTDTAYDCSGSVSFALHGAGLLDATLDSTELSAWGRSGAGRWVTVYANKTHTYLVVAGIRFDTSGQRAAGTRWQAAPRSNKGFRVRHPAGL